MDEERAELTGPHLGSKRLTAYRQGRLPAAEHEAVQEHLSVCPRCTGLLRELRDFEAATAGAETGPEARRQEAWEALARRLPPAAPAVRPVRSAADRSAPQPPPRWRRALAAAAAALLLAVAGLTLWTVTVQRESRRLARLEQRLQERDAALAELEKALAETRRQRHAARGPAQRTPPDEARSAARIAELEARIAELSAALEELRRERPGPEGQEPAVMAARDVEVSVAPLFALRGQEPAGEEFLRAGGAVNPVRQESPGDPFTVTLSLGDQPVQGEYRLELIGQHAKALWTGRRPGRSLLGDAGTSLSIRGLAPGRYRLRIHGPQADRGALLAEYLLEVGPTASRR